MSQLKEEAVMVGAFSTFSCNIDGQANNAFNEAFENFVGVKYSPVAVSQQVVAGMNYRFFCNSKMVTPFSVNGSAMVSIYKPLNGNAHIVSIQNID